MVRLDEGGAAAADVQLFAPAPPLRPWVQHVSIQPGPARRGRWRVVPDTCAHVIVSVARGAAWCRVVGARSTYADIDVADRSFTVAVRLRPGALPALVRDDAAAFTDRAVDLADAIGVRAAPCAADLAALAPIAIATLLMRAIERRCEGLPAPREGNVLARTSRVDDVARLLALPVRSAHARIVGTIGLAPKRALRIHRLHAALHTIRGGHSPACAATMAGYSDQAHFTRDARDLLGEPPIVWLRRGAADSFKTHG